MLLPNRHGNSSDYRYGFNGKEKDDEVKGEGVQYDYGFRIYDPRLGKFLSTDPLSSNFPYYTPYQFAGNKPIWAIDLDGLEEVFYDDLLKTSIGKVAIELTRKTELAKQFNEVVKSQNGLDIYFFTFESKVGSTDPNSLISTTGKIDDNGTLERGFTRGTSIFTKNAKDFNLKRYSYFALGTANNLDIETIKKSYAEGNGVIFIGISKQMLNPLDYVSDDIKKIIDEQGVNSPRIQKILKTAIENVMGTLIHEAIAHALEDLKNPELASKDRSKEDHKKFHGRKTSSSPSIEDYDKNPNEFKGTTFEKTIKQTRKQTKTLNKIEPKS